MQFQQPNHFSVNAALIDLYPQPLWHYTLKDFSSTGLLMKQGTYELTFTEPQTGLGWKGP